VPLAITGVAAVVRWAYYDAAVVHGYRIGRDDAQQWHVRATVIHVNRVNLELGRGALVFVATHQGGEWTWPIESYTLTENLFTARLGPPDTGSHVPLRHA